MTNRKSRMAKNAQLHQELLSEKEDKIITKELSPFANQLNNIDNQFERMDIPLETDENYVSPLHHRNERYVPKQEADIEVKESVDEEVEDIVERVEDTGFSNDFLEDFIDEVKQYNVEKGYRNTVDTQSNVLSGLDGWQSNLRPFGNQAKPVTTEMTLEEQLKEMPTIEAEPEEVIEENDEETIMLEVRRLAEIDEKEPFVSNELEETIAFEIEAPQEEEKIETEIQESVTEQTFGEKLINFFLYLLIFASIIVIGIIIYIVLSVNGII